MRVVVQISYSAESHDILMYTKEDQLKYDDRLVSLQRHIIEDRAHSLYI